MAGPALFPSSALPGMRCMYCFRGSAADRLLRLYGRVEWVGGVVHAFDTGVIDYRAGDGLRFGRSSASCTEPSYSSVRRPRRHCAVMLMWIYHG